MRIREELTSIQRHHHGQAQAIATVDVLQFSSVTESQQLNRLSFAKNGESRSTNNHRFVE